MLNFAKLTGSGAVMSVWPNMYKSQGSFNKNNCFEIATSERTRSEPGFFGSRRSRSRLSLLSLSLFLSLSLSLWRRPVVGRCLAREGDVLASRLSAALRSRSARTAAASVTAPAVVPRLMAAAGGGAGRGGAVVWLHASAARAARQSYRLERCSRTLRSARRSKRCR